jgi:hypothetical protein
VTIEAGFAIAMDGAHCGTDLIIGVRADVLHQEIDPARVALQNAQDLQSAVTYVHLRRFARFHWLGVAEMSRDVFRQKA